MSPLIVICVAVAIFIVVAVAINYRPQKCPSCRKRIYFSKRPEESYVTERDEEDSDIPIEIASRFSCPFCGAAYVHVWNDYEGQRVVPEHEAPAKIE